MLLWNVYMSQHLGNIVHTLLPQQEAWKVYLIQNWSTITGDLSDKMCIIDIQKTTLVIGVYEASWLQELYFLSSLLLTKINQHLDKPRLNTLRFKAVGRKKKKKFTKPIIIEQNKKITLTNREKDALERISDTQLRTALKQFLIRCYRET